MFRTANMLKSSLLLRIRLLLRDDARYLWWTTVNHFTVRSNLLWDAFPVVDLS
jgi:hypothetical protein